MDPVRQSSLESNAVQPPNVREAVGVFANADSLHAAIVELDTYFPRHAISVIGGKKEIEEKFGQSVISPTLAENSSDIPLEAPLRSEEKVIGLSALIGTSAYVGAVTLALAAGAVSMPAIIVAAVIGGAGGAAISGVLAKVLGDHYHKDIEDQIAKGGLLLWVNTLNPDQEKIACDILNKYGAMYVKVIEHRNHESNRIGFSEPN